MCGNATGNEGISRLMTRDHNAARVPAAAARGRNPFSSRRLGAAPAIAIVLLFLSVGAGAVLMQILALAPATENHQRAQVENGATMLARQLESRIRMMQQVAEDLAAAPAVVSVLGDDLPLARASLEDQLSTVLPYLLRLRILPAGSAQVALDEDPPLSFAGVEMIRRAEEGASPLPEALRLEGQAVAMVNVARRVVDQEDVDPDRVLGTVLLTFDTTVISEILRRMDLDRSGVTLDQAVGGQRLAFLDLGIAEDVGIATRLDLAHSGWQLRYRSLEAGPLPLSWLDLAPGLALILIGTLLGILLGYRRLAATLRNDLTALVDTASEMLENSDAVPANRIVLEPVVDADAALRIAVAGTLRKARSAARPSEVPSSPAPAPAPAPAAAASAATEDFLEIRDEPDASEEPSEEIFRAYDIRGIVGDTLNEAIAFQIGRAIGSEAADAGETQVVVGADGRHSSPALKDRLSDGIMASGVDVLDIGAVPTPILYYATHVTGSTSGVMITGSHNPPEYNGFKVVIAGETLAGDRITALRERIVAGNLREGSGLLEERDLIPQYIERIASDVTLAQPLKVVADCGNGIAGRVVPSLLEALGCEVLPLYCDVDGDFPNHHPDPADPDNLTDLITVVKAEGADIGLAFDGDGDRLGVVTERGEIIWPDRLLMLFCRDIVGRNPGADVIFDVKCSRHLNALIAEYGGRPIMWRTGHSHIKAKMKETQALIGGEFSGHICFGERWYGFDDGLYSAARLLEILAAEGASAGEVFDEFPNPPSTPEMKIKTTEEAKFRIIEALARGTGFEGGDLTTIDGVRVDYPEGWGLIRASNTSPTLTLRFEADDAAALTEIQQRFEQALQQVDPELTFSNR